MIMEGVVKGERKVFPPVVLLPKTNDTHNGVITAGATKSHERPGQNRVLNGAYRYARPRLNACMSAVRGMIKSDTIQVALTRSVIFTGWDFTYVFSSFYSPPPPTNHGSDGQGSQHESARLLNK